ncbi:DUF3072 domain-containing protein [bacterium]|nr:MAG: DUF3072 domain-containing protein [bacterium]
MDKQHTNHDSPDPALNRDPSEWKTGGEPLTAAQRSYVETLAHEAGEEVEAVESLTKAEASEKIEELQEKTGRGRSN